ncbi:MAG: cob(I)yrinic acid a,c-diamide adenosyltransferase [Candidatus Sedimenticola sp. (ex Thyasira tokunagai)]
MTIDQKHSVRMQRKKSVVDESINRADRDKGLLLVHTGNGKGKSSSGFGMLARALGHDMRVGVVQFIKSPGSTGEERFFRRQANVVYHVIGDGFTWETQNREQDIATARQGWAQALKLLGDKKIELLLLDELNTVLNTHYLPLEEVLEGLHGRSEGQHVIVTGRGAPAELIEAADTVTEMKMIKHAFKNGIKAQQGIEF